MRQTSTGDLSDGGASHSSGTSLAVRPETARDGHRPTWVHRQRYLPTAPSFRRRIAGQCPRFTVYTRNLHRHRRLIPVHVPQQREAEWHYVFDIRSVSRGPGKLSDEHVVDVIVERRLDLISQWPRLCRFGCFRIGFQQSGQCRIAVPAGTALPAIEGYQVVRQRLTISIPFTISGTTLQPFCPTGALLSRRCATVA
jgi:hypothetical protein